MNEPRRGRSRSRSGGGADPDPETDPDAFWVNLGRFAPFATTLEDPKQTGPHRSAGGAGATIEFSPERPLGGHFRSRDSNPALPLVQTQKRSSLAGAFRHVTNAARSHWRHAPEAGGEGAGSGAGGMAGFGVANERLRALEELEREIGASLQSAGGRGLGKGAGLAGKGRGRSRGVLLGGRGEALPGLGRWAGLCVAMVTSGRGFGGPMGGD